MMELHIDTGYKKYPIVFTDSFDIMQSVIDRVGFKPTSICIVTDENVEKLYFQEVYSKLDKTCKNLIKYVIKPGEKYKTLQTVENIIEKCVENKFGRDSAIIALGGGVVGDIAGFAASIYMRGIKFAQIPTTLLSQNDSSVGGKVGVDFNNHKNMLGAFYQPEFVYINTEVLKTLSAREFASGMAEVIKHSLIRDNNLYDFLINNVAAIQKAHNDTICKMNYISCSIKGEVVSKDEKEGSLRKILNFGHTIGHAIETLSNFRYTHGESVALGMVAASYISFLRNMITKQELEKVCNIIELYNLPIKMDNINLDKNDIYKQLFYDKKVKENNLVFILINNIGSCTEVNDVTKDEILSSIEYLQKGD